MKILIARIAAFVTNANIVQPSEKVSVCRDPKDDMLLECGVTAKAEILITSDKDLLAIKDLSFNLEIVTPEEFLKES